MKSYLIVGSNIKINLDQVKNSFLENGHTIEIHGNGERLIDCQPLNIPAKAPVIVYAHGRNKDGHHQIQLCKKTTNTYESITSLSNNKPINIELFSCFSESASRDIKLLPKGSTLVTLQTDNYQSSLSLDSEIIKRSANFINQDNPFIKFASYILSNPNTNRFSINVDGPYITFKSDINDISGHLKNSSTIQNWQNNQVNSFIKFCQIIKKNLDSNSTGQINYFLKLFNDTQFRSEWISSFDTNRYKELLLIKMSHENKITLIQEILQTGIDVNAKQENKATSVFMAAQKCQVEPIVALFEARASLEKTPDDNYTPLHRAVEDGCFEVVKILIKLGANIEAKLPDGRTSLIIASYKGNVDIVAELIKSGASINTKAGMSALYAAAQEGHANIVKILLDAGASINEKYVDDYTALEIATQQGHNEVVGILEKALALSNSFSLDLSLSSETSNFVDSEIILYKNYNSDTAHKFYNKGHQCYKEGRELFDLSKILLANNNLLDEAPKADSLVVYSFDALTTNPNDASISLSIQNNHNICKAYNLYVHGLKNMLEGQQNMKSGQEIMIELGFLDQFSHFDLLENSVLSSFLLGYSDINCGNMLA